MTPRATGITRRLPVEDEAGDIVGWVLFESLADFVKVEGVYVPAEFHLRFPGSPEQPSLLITFHARDDALVCAAITIESKTEGREVLPKDFEITRRKLRDWKEMACKAVMHAAEQSGESLALSRNVSPATARKAYNAAQKRSRTKITDKLLREVAQLYRDNVEEGPWQAITERYGVSESTAGRYVLLARKAGYLPPTKSGKKKA